MPHGLISLAFRNIATLALRLLYLLFDCSSYIAALLTAPVYEELRRVATAQPAPACTLKVKKKKKDTFLWVEFSF